MKTFRTLFLTSVFFTSIFAHAGNMPQYSNIFTLERTLNENQVVYEANLSNPDYPIHPYWVMRAQDGHFEELTRTERSRAYGVEIIKQSATEVSFVLVSFRSHPVTVRLDAATGLPYATVVLSSGEKILKDIFITVSGRYIPTVSKLDISYQDTKDGPILQASFDPNGDEMEKQLRRRH